MKSKKIVKLADGTANGDAVNKAQLDAVKTQVTSQVITVNNQVTKNKTDIVTINTNNGYYYFTDQLKHNNSNKVKFPRAKFPPIDSYPFARGSDDYKFKIRVDGYYQIIYTDFYQKSGQFIIHDDTNGNDLFVISLDNQSGWAPITINAVIPITVDNGFRHAEIKLYIQATNNAILDGAGIQYILY